MNEENKLKKKIPEKLSLSMAVKFYAGAIAAALVWGLIAGHPLLILHPDREPRILPAELLMQFLAGVIFVVAVVLLSSTTSKRFLWARRLEMEFARLIGPLSTRDIAIMAILSGIGEELFFRGAMQPSLGLVATSLIFGLLHIGPGKRFLPWTAFALVIGFVLGWFFEETGTLLAPIVAHIGINLINLKRLQKRFYEMQVSPPD